MLRPFLLGVGAALAAITALGGVGHAQQRGPSSREDLLDALTRHIQICAEMTDSQARLGCYDRLQTQVGGVQPGPPSPTPLRPGTAGTPPIVQAVPPSGSPPGQPMVPPPLGVPGGGTASL